MNTQRIGLVNGECTKMTTVLAKKRSLVALVLVAFIGGMAWAKPPLAKPPSKRVADPFQIAHTDPIGDETQEKNAPVDPSAPKPVIKVDETVHDFGGVWVGPPLRHSFKIKNEGEKTLEIGKVRPACGCTIAGEYPKKLEPGETGEFPFTMQSNKLRGTFEKGITISSNDPLTPDLRLKLRGEVKRYVDVIPQGANFGKLTTQEIHERVINITGNMDTPLKLTLQPPADSKFKFDLVEKVPGKQFDLHVTASPPFDEGQLKTTLMIQTNVEAQKEIPVDISATVPARLEIQPPTVTLSKPRSDGPSTEPISRVLKVTNYGKNPVKVLEATCDDPTVTLSVTERKPGEAYTVQVQLPANYQPPAEGRNITIKTDDPQKSAIAVPIQGPPAAPASADRKPVKPAEMLVGQTAPSFSLTTVDGKPLNNDTLLNTVTVLDFFAPNCGFCKKQMPRLESIREKYADKGVRFAAISQKMGAKEFSQKEVVDIVTGLNFKPELVIDHENTSGPLFKATSYPTMVVVGKTGKIEAVNAGNVADLETRLTGQLDALLAGKPIPATEPSTQPAEAPKRARPDDLVGKPAPSFALKTVAGKPLSSADFTSSPATVLNFFAPNCGFCKKQIPRLETIRKEYQDKGVRFVNVAETMGKQFSEEETLKILKDLSSELEVARDPENQVGPMFNATGYPTMVVIGKSGRVEAVNVGNAGDLETRLKGQLDALIAGKPVPTAAAMPPAPATPDKPNMIGPLGPPEKTPDAYAQAPKSDTPKPEAPKPAPGRPDDLVGKPAPTFSLTTVTGKSLSNADFANAPATVLNFFAPNCGFCKKQIPQLETIRKSYAEKGVRFVNVAETMGKEFPEEETLKILKDLGAELEVARDPGNKVGPLFNATGYPTMVVVGKSGKVDAVTVGAVPDLDSRVKGQLDALIAGKPVPPELAKAPAPAPRPQPQDVTGKPAPAIALTTTAGKPVSNAEFANAPATVLNFFAPNCGFCKKQIPRVEAIRKEYQAKGVRFVNVVETMGKEFSEEETAAILKELGSELEVARDPGNKVGPTYNATGYPTMVVVGKSGKIEVVNVGNIGDLETRMKGQLDALIEGKPIPAQFAQAPAPPARPQPQDVVGKPAPAIALTTSAGKPVANAEFATAPATVLNFFAPNCGFCKKQIPRVETIRKEYQGKGVRFVNVVETMGKEFSEEETTAILKELGSELEVARDPGNKVGPAYNATGYPTMVIVGKSGKIEAVNSGNIGDLETRLKGQLDALIEGKPIPPQFAQAPAAPARARPDDLVGKPAPAFALTTNAGKPLSNAELASAPATVLNFFAPNCGFCKKQIPRLETVRKEYQAKGIRFVNVVETMGKEFTEEETTTILKELGAELEVARDPGNKVGPTFNATGYPTMVVVGKSGKVEAVNVGNIGDLESRLKGQLDALLEGKPVPQAAAPAPPGPPSPGQQPAIQQPPQRPAMALVGTQAPAFSLDTLDGKKVSDTEFKKHPATVLNFVAPNCGFCKKQMPNVETVRAEYEAKGVRFVNVAQKMGAKEFTTEEMVDVFKTAGSRLELAKDADNKVGQLFKAVSFPTMVVVDRNGKIEHVNIGAQQELDKNLKTQLDGLIAGAAKGGSPSGGQ